jgi:hypothetical protein
MQKFVKFTKGVMTQGAITALTTSLASNYVNTTKIASVIRASATSVEAKVIAAPLDTRDTVTVAISAGNADTINSIIDAFAIASVQKPSSALSVYVYDTLPSTQTIDSISLG